MDVTVHVQVVPDRRYGASRDRLVHRVHAEFEELPGLRLTCRQAQRLFGLRPDICERVFAMLVGEQSLTRGPDERYGVREDVAWRGREHRARGPQQRAPRAS
jgi:hypothetical protein